MRPLPDGRAILIVGSDTPIRRALAVLIDALGATVVARSPRELSDRGDPGAGAAVVLGDDVVADLGAAGTVSLLQAMRGMPQLIVGLGAGAAVLDALTQVTGIRVDVAQPARVDEYTFAPDEPLLWPFGGLVLRERRARVVEPLMADDRAMEPLISTGSGPIFARLGAPGAAVYVTTVSGWAGGPPPVLIRAFRDEDFLDTLPVMVFARAMLAGRGWTRPALQATCMVDDPNLRRMQYGHLDYRAAIRLSRERPFHLSVGFVPLDYRSTSSRVAQLFRDHPEALSLVIHGNDHGRLELARAVSDEEAVRSARQALARMQRHRALTGLTCPAVMTPPHGACTRPWIRALGAAGYVAVVATATHPFAELPEEEGADELHELFCAELGLYGFPIILRFPAIGYRIRWLFAAWLGKPLVIYAHHGDFAGDAGGLLSGVDYINERIAPRWASIADVIRDNYLMRSAGRAAEVRVFSNDTVVSVPDGVEELVVVKQGHDIPWETEIVLVDDDRVEDVERSSDALGVRVPVDGRQRVRVRFAPREPFDSADDWQGISLRSRTRRMLTEVRDRLAPVLSKGGRS